MAEDRLLKRFQEFENRNLEPLPFMFMEELPEEVECPIVSGDTELLLETIQVAAQSRLLVTMTYSGIPRLCEFYSFRTRTRKSDGCVVLYCFCWDRTRNRHIKSFFAHKIEGIRIDNIRYKPKWQVEVEGEKVFGIFERLVNDL